MLSMAGIELPPDLQSLRFLSLSPAAKEREYVYAHRDRVRGAQRPYKPLPRLRRRPGWLAGGRESAASPAVRARGEDGDAGLSPAVAVGNRGRTTADWITEAILHRQAVQLGLVHFTDVALNTDQPSA